MKSNTSLNLRQIFIGFLIVGAMGTAYAEELAPLPDYTLLDAIKEGKNLTSFRLRYETVDQDAYQPAPNANKKLERGNALTLRSLVGWQTAPFHNFSFTAQAINVGKFQDDYNNRSDNVPQPGKTQYPAIVDPDNTDINQLFVDWTGIKNTRVRLGRQQLNLDNVRFVGDIGFRQVMQVFNGISVLNKSIPDTEIFVSHFDRVKQITTLLRSGNFDLINAKYRISPSESLVGYGYFVDADNLGQNGGDPTKAGNIPQAGNGLGASSDTPATSNADTNASSRTLGLRLDGVHKLDDHWKALYTAEYAKQDNYKGGSNLIDAHYHKFGGGAMYNLWSLRIDQEVLSSNHGKYAFQTPLGTNHLFQGWADLFLITPRQGIKDTCVTFGTGIEKAKILAEYHVFYSDENFTTIGGKSADKYGTEFDVSVAYPFTDKFNAKLEYAKFNEGDVYGTTLKAAFRKPDTEKIWVTAMYTF